MPTYLYKAYDSVGHKKVGTLYVLSPQEAILALRERGLKAYFVEDLAKVKRVLQHRQRVRKTVIGFGAGAIVLALGVSAGMVGYAGRAKPLATADYQQAGLVEGGSGNFAVDSEKGEKLAKEMVDAWNSFAPGVLTGIEIHKSVMTIHVGRAVRKLDPDDLDHLASNSVRALHRQLNARGAMLLILEEDVTMLEVRYNSVTNSTHITRYL